MSDEPNGKATSMTRHARQRLIVSVIAIGLLSGGCQGCARPKVKTALVEKGMSVAKAEAILGRPFSITDMVPSPPLSGKQLRRYENGDQWVEVMYKKGIVDEVHESSRQPWWRLW
jgi:hypothetical protein